MKSTGDLGSLLWTPVLSQIPGADTPIKVIDPNAVVAAWRFYRVTGL